MATQVVERYQNIIGGSRVGSASGEEYENHNPADHGDTVGRFPRSTAGDVRQAVEAATEAQQDWGALPPPQRGDVLFRAAELLAGRKGELARLLTREEGKTIAESTGEVQRAIDIFRYYGSFGRRLNGETIARDKADSLVYTVRMPLGVVALITPWNYPIAIPAWKLGPALISGNAVVWKPASLTPLIGLRLAETLIEAGLPDGVLNVVMGSGRVVGQELVTHPSVAGISFTGSYQVGCGIHEQAANSMTRTQLEMGGKNPLVIMADADLDLAVTLTRIGAFGVTGQACTATSRAIVHEAVAAEYTERMVELARSLKVGNGLDPDVDMGPAASQSELDGDLEYVQIGRDEGATLLTGGRRLEGGDYDQGYFVEPSVFADVEPEMRIAQEEIFGPVLSIIQVGSFEEAVEVANGIEYGLSASLVTRDLRQAMRFTETAEAGVVKVNQPTTGLSLQAPFGGVKHSSSATFREQGEVAVDFYSVLKTVYVGY